MADPFLGEIRLVGFNYAPEGWAFCQGQLLPISQNTALFSLLGTQYGGNGISTFGLPNLQGRVVVGQGQGPGLSSYLIGESEGTETVTLPASTLPAHSHSVPASASAGHGAVPGPTVALGSGGRGSQPIYASPALQNANPVTMSGLSCGETGGNGAHNNMMPYLVSLYVIALEGIYPARS